MAATPVILDVDTGIDDAFALLYAVASPEIEILGVASVAGNVDLNKATRNTRQVLALAGRADIPVWPGCVEPLLHAPASASEIHGQSGLGYAHLPEPTHDNAPRHAIDAIIEMAKAREGEIVLIATGPLTNIAAALMRDPHLPRRLKRLVIMGGAFRHAGNVTATAEFNIWHDPEAARMVFRAFGAEGAAPLVAVGLDVTSQTKFTHADLAAIEARCAGLKKAPALLRFLEDSSRFYFELMQKWYGAPYLLMHDPLAVGVAIDPSFVKTEKATVDVETSGRLTAGMTVADWRGRWKRGANAEIASEVDAPRFIAAFVEAIERLAKRLG